MVVFGDILKKLRLDSGMTQKDLAIKVGVTKSVISYYELSERAPSPDVLIKLSSIFHVTTDYLLGIEKQECVDLTGLSIEDKSLIYTMVNTLRKKDEYRK